MKKLSVVATLTLCCCMTLPTAIHAQGTLINTNSTMQKDGVKMQGGRVMQTKNGQTTPLMSDIKLKDGKKVSTNGTVTDRNGKTWKLREGESIDMNGVVKKASMNNSNL